MNDRIRIDSICQKLNTKRENVVWSVNYLEESHREICFRLQQCAQTHKLGLGGENTVELVCDKLDELLGKSSKDWS